MLEIYALYVVKRLEGGRELLSKDIIPCRKDHDNDLILPIFLPTVTPETFLDQDLPFHGVEHRVDLDLLADAG